MREDVKQKHFSTPLPETPVWCLHPGPFFFVERILVLTPAAPQLWSHFEHRTVVAGLISAASWGCAIEVAGGIEDQAAPEASPVCGTAAQTIDRLRPVSARRRGQFEDRAAAVIARPSTAAHRRPVEISGSIEDHAGERFKPVGAVERKVMQNRLSPDAARFRRQLEHCAAPGTEIGRESCREGA